MRARVLTLVACVAVSTAALGQSFYTANLDGLQEVPPNASPGFGSAFLALNAAQDQITVDLNWQDLLAPALAAHIHGPAGPGSNAPVLFTLAGVAGHTTGASPGNIFSVTSGQVADLQAGNWYIDIHTSVFPGGEIRGQFIQETPEPSSLALLGLGAAALARRRFRR